jgi:hypothetical protein
MDKQTALSLLALGLFGRVSIIYTGGPVESEPIQLIGSIEFDPMWALVGGTGFALAYGAAGFLNPDLVD